MRFSTIKDTGIKEMHSNGGRNQEIIWKIKETNEKFRLIIHSESYKFQSYYRLYKWSNENNEWNIITSGNPSKDYSIDIAYHSQYSAYAFDPIIKDMKKIAKEF
jgi:hypothetical protein